MRVFYVPDFKAGPKALPEEEAKHAIRVLRMRIGDQLEVVDGKGYSFICEIKYIEGKRCKLEVLQENFTSLSEKNNLHIAIAPTKQIDRIEWFLEKATEIGIKAITPIFCTNSERKTIKLDRLEKILVAAMKQSKQAYLPKLNKPLAFEELVVQSAASEKYIAHCYNQDKKHLKTVYEGKDAMVLIGPEGDFDLEEVELATLNGFKPISLGDTRLRTETAGIIACHTIQLHHV